MTPSIPPYSLLFWKISKANYFPSNWELVEFFYPTLVSTLAIWRLIILIYRIAGYGIMYVKLWNTLYTSNNSINNNSFKCSVIIPKKSEIKNVRKGFFFAKKNKDIIMLKSCVGTVDRMQYFRLTVLTLPGVRLLWS